jgi:hypothetical protein
MQRLRTTHRRGGERHVPPPSSPATRRHPHLDLTDMSVFDGDRGSTLAIIVNTSLAVQGRLPGFHAEGDDEAAGMEVAHGITGADPALSIDHEIRVWAGTAADPFHLDLGQLAHIIEGPQSERQFGTPALPRSHRKRDAITTPTPSARQRQKEQSWTSSVPPSTPKQPRCPTP